MINMEKEGREPQCQEDGKVDLGSHLLAEMRMNAASDRRFCSVDVDALSAAASPSWFGEAVIILAK